MPKGIMPTTFIDEERVARVPKRTDMFARSQFGDLGKKVQNGALGGWYARKNAPATAQRRALGAFVLLQDGAPETPDQKPADAERNSENVKAASYFLGIDAVGISRCPDWTWYSHDATGAELIPPHHNAISMIIDQGFETMEGASGDDVIDVRFGRGQSYWRGHSKPAAGAAFKVWRCINRHAACTR